MTDSEVIVFYDQNSITALDLLGKLHSDVLFHTATMDVQSALPSSTIFHELQTVHDTGYFYSMPSLEDDWAQVKRLFYFLPFSTL